MSIVTIFIMIMVVSLLINGILSLIYKNKEKVDKGFTYAYANLSYRRKMIRTLWSLPLLISLLLMLNIAIVLHTHEKQFIFVSLLLLFLIQLAYNYYKWKKSENSYL